MTFYTGQKVTMKRDHPWFYDDVPQPSEGRPVFGHVYAISVIAPDPQFPAWQILEFLEFPGHVFEAHNFRPVVEPKTDISIFTAMLGPTKMRQTECA